MAEPAVSETSLRQWLDRPERHVDRSECLHLFHEIAEIVDMAHRQGVAVGNVRPSCFVLSATNRVAFIESDSCPSSASDPGLDSASGEESCSSTGCGGGVRATRFPLKQKLMLEDEWYTCPDGNTFASDVYRLGVILFELFCTFDSMDEKLRSMSNLRHRVLPPQLLLKWPKEASFCLWLLHPRPETRPRMSEVLRSEFLNESRNNLEEYKASINIKEELEEQELLLEFLSHLQKKKQKVADNLHDTICFLLTDIEEVLSQQSTLLDKGSSFSEFNDVVNFRVESLNPTRPSPLGEEDSSHAGSGKQFKPEFQCYSEENQNEVISEISIAKTLLGIPENILLKSSRMMKNFKKFEAAYLSTRCRWMKPASTLSSPHFRITSPGSGLIARIGGSSVGSIISKDGHGGKRKTEWINLFLEGLCKYLSFSKLNVRAELKQGDLLNMSNLVCSLGFDRDKEFFATAGANRKINIFECDVILNESDIHYPVVEMKSRSKVSCISWNSYIKSQIASSDFEGIVQVWDVSRGQVSVEMREHARRVWSVEFSPSDPMKLASGSDDGAVKLWNINQLGSIGTIQTKANVCSVQFPPDSSQSLAIGSADHRVYCYDLRNLKVPCCTLIGHTKTVSYVKYLESSTIVSASTDSSLKLWDLSTSTSRVLDNPSLTFTFTGHTNVKNFVGLSVHDGYIATGSETNEKFDVVDPITGLQVEDGTQFISTVCWRGESTILIAANSSGDIKLLEMV